MTWATAGRGSSTSSKAYRGKNWIPPLAKAKTLRSALQRVAVPCGFLAFGSRKRPICSAGSQSVPAPKMAAMGSSAREPRAWGPGLITGSSR